jgi:hypothetical protein
VVQSPHLLQRSTIFFVSCVARLSIPLLQL